MYKITLYSDTIRAQPLNIKGYFGEILYPTTIKQSTTSIDDYDINIILKIFCNCDSIKSKFYIACNSLCLPQWWHEQKFLLTNRFTVTF